MGRTITNLDPAASLIILSRYCKINQLGGALQLFYCHHSTSLTTHDYSYTHELLVLPCYPPCLPWSLGKESAPKERTNLDTIGGISSGIYQDTPILDLNYPEDKDASVDFNIVMTDDLDFVELQGSGEESTFSSEEMTAMLDLARKGIGEITELQKQAIQDADQASLADLDDLAGQFKRP